MNAARIIIPALTSASHAASRKLEWLMSTSEGHKAATLIIAFAAPWVIFS